LPVTNPEVDTAFYDSHRDSSGNLPATLVDSKTGTPRKLTADPADAEFRKEWAKIKEHLEFIKGSAPATGGPPLSPIGNCPLTKNTDAPPYEPDKWNNDPDIKESTNCYAYAMDSRTGHPKGDKPQPGEKSTTSFTLDCDSLKAAVLADAATNAADAVVEAPQCPYQKQHKLPPPERPGYYQVALVRTSRINDYEAATKEYYVGDYHWYRENGDGTWSHKPGHDPAVNADSSGNPITNPEIAARRSTEPDTATDPTTGTTFPITVVTDYDIFCGYFYVKKGGSAVG
jgi:hypothetical protein